MRAKCGRSKDDHPPLQKKFTWNRFLLGECARAFLSLNLGRNRFNPFPKDSFERQNACKSLQTLTAQARVLKCTTDTAASPSRLSPQLRDIIILLEAWSK
jgi:hypothetical protein